MTSTGPDFSRSTALLDRALKTIPLGAQTFSKSHEHWVRGAAPLFLDHGQGARIWDVDGNVFVDYVLGLLPVVLGYCDPDVDTAIRTQLERGISFSTAIEAEVELAERLVRLIPCAEMVRFGKNGSDATTAAIRLARAFTGRDKVVTLGYHGWHDWYIGTTIRHRGIPQAVRDLSIGLPFNDADALADLLAREGDQIAGVILEPAGGAEPAEGYLQRVRELTEKHGVLLIFDEVVTGFRINLGGAQTEYGVIPDLAAFGKAMANGMPISTVVGRRDIMMEMEKVFVSTTFGGEALSIAAAIATIDKIEREGVVDRLKAIGQRLTSTYNATASRYGLGDIIAMAPVSWCPKLKMKQAPVPANLLNSLLRQSYTQNGVLMSASFNLCLAHEKADVLADTEIGLDRALAQVAEALNSADPAAFLKGPMIQPVFQVRQS